MRTKAGQFLFQDLIRHQKLKLISGGCSEWWGGTSFPRTERWITIRRQTSSPSCVTHVGSAGGHEDGEVREVVAGAGGGVGAHVHGPAAPGGPAALQAVGLVLPESTFDGVLLGVHGLRG